MAGRQPFKSAIVHYTYDGSEKGEETFYMRDRGLEQVHIRKTTGRVLFSTVTTNKIMIMTRDMVTDIDMEKKTGIKHANPIKFHLEEYNKLSSAEKETVKKNLLAMGAQMSNMTAGLMTVAKKADSVLGYKCDVVSGLGTKTWSIADTGIVLKSEITLIGSTTKMAAKVETDVSIPASAFEPPAGVNVVYSKEIDERNQESAKKMIEMLKDPNMAKSMEKQSQEGSARQGSGERRSPSGVKDPEITDQQRKEADQAVKKSVDALRGIFGGK
jgi:hypothetical protein